MIAFQKALNALIAVDDRLLALHDAHASEAEYNEARDAKGAAIAAMEAAIARTREG